MNFYLTQLIKKKLLIKKNFFLITCFNIFDISVSFGKKIQNKA